MIEILECKAGYIWFRNLEVNYEGEYYPTLILFLLRSYSTLYLKGRSLFLTQKTGAIIERFVHQPILTIKGTSKSPWIASPDSHIIDSTVKAPYIWSGAKTLRSLWRFKH